MEYHSFSFICQVTLSGVSFQVVYLRIIIYLASMRISWEGVFPKACDSIGEYHNEAVEYADPVHYVCDLLWHFPVTGFTFPSNAWVAVIPLLLLMISVLGFGIGLIFSSLTIKYQDLNVMLGVGMNLLMYAALLFIRCRSFRDLEKSCLDQSGSRRDRDSKIYLFGWDQYRLPLCSGSCPDHDCNLFRACAVQ